MTNVKSLWHLTGAKWIDNDPEVDVLAVTVAGNGTEYAICIAGNKGMNVNEIVAALRAGTAGLIHVAGGDMRIVGAESPDDAMFDTGDQRPS
jgi:hypothetical protein